MVQSIEPQALSIGDKKQIKPEMERGQMVAAITPCNLPTTMIRYWGIHSRGTVWGIQGEWHRA